MKKIISSSICFILLFSLSGCYTVAWQPGEELPVREEVSFNNSNYYNVNDFGVFSYYYNSAWWLNEDYDFLLNNFNTVLDINSIITDGYYLDNGPIIDVIPPTQNIPRNIINNKTKDQTKTRANNNDNKNVRNNNGSRNNSKGKGR